MYVGLVGVFCSLSLFIIDWVSSCIPWETKFLFPPFLLIIFALFLLINIYIYIYIYISKLSNFICQKKEPSASLDVYRGVYKRDTRPIQKEGVNKKLSTLGKQSPKEYKKEFLQ